MTKKLEDIFNLDSEVKNAPVIKDEKAVHEQITSVDETYKAIEKITTGLPQIQELNDIDDKELDHLASKAEQAYDDLMDLGMNVEVRYASRIFEVAGTMMKNAIDAKSAKIDKKLKSIDLQMKKYKIDRDANDDPNNVLNGEGYIITDRNDLLKKLGQKN
jgi:hypothetical protein